MEPTPLKQWVEETQVDDKYLWKGSALEQFKDFFQFAETLGGEPMVVSSHRSKSISLPVVQVDTEYGVRVILRDNFHDINVSVWLPEPCNHDLFGIPASGDRYLFFQGFASEWKLPYFHMETQAFSNCLGYSQLIPFAEALKWRFGPSEQEFPWRDWPKGEFFLKEGLVRSTACNSNFPVIYRKDSISVLYRFFESPHEFEPNEDLLRQAFTDKGPDFLTLVRHAHYRHRYEKPSPEDQLPIPYLELDFTSGCPKPVDKWLKVLNKLVAERRADTTVDSLGDRVGAAVNITHLTPTLLDRARLLECSELVTPDRS